MADFIVTGTGRCGTAHCLRVLKLLGVPSSHETFFNADRRTFDESDRKAYAEYPSNDISLFAAPFLRAAGVPAIHLVRDPVACVNSLLHLRLPLSCDHPLCEFIRRSIAPEGECEEELWVDYWEKWNRLCADAATLTVRVESLSNGEVSEESLTSLVGAPGFVQQWRTLGITKNRIHQVNEVLVPDRLLPRLRRAGEAYGYGT
jgi:hypothetical protein